MVPGEVKLVASVKEVVGNGDVGDVGHVGDVGGVVLVTGLKQALTATSVFAGLSRSFLVSEMITLTTSSMALPVKASSSALTVCKSEKKNVSFKHCRNRVYEK